MEEKDKSKLTIFGKDLGDKERWDKTSRCRPHSGGIFWGMLFVFFGVAFLLNNLGVIPWSAWNGLWSFWPVILIVIGIEVLFGHSLLSRCIIFLLTLFIFLTIFGVVLVKTTPQTLNSVPNGVVQYLHTVSKYLETK